LTKKKRARKKKLATGRDALRAMGEVRTRSKLQAAVSYARLGIPVIPLSHVRSDGVCSCGHEDCPCPGKHLLYAGAEEQATTDHRKVFGGWKRCPHTNIGTPLGTKFAHFVLDLDADNRAGAMALLSYVRDAYGIGRPSAIALSAGRNAAGGGLHLHYCTPVGAQLGTLLEENGSAGLTYVPPDPTTEVPSGILAAIPSEPTGAVEIYGDVASDQPHVSHTYISLPPSTNAGMYRWVNLEEVWT
jgi:hypothetical protein